MNRILKIFIPLIVAMFYLQACDNNDEEVASYPTMDTFLNSKPELSMFSQALDKAQLQTFKNGQGPFTWFAPSNEAFIAAGITQDSLNKMTAGQISYLLLYHLINPTTIPIVPVYTTDMVAQSSFAKASQIGQNFYLGKLLDSFYMNGFPMTSLDNRVDNGVVHITSAFNIPPNVRGNIQTILNSTGQHSLFIAALTKASRWTALGSTSVFTVNAPTDAAMTAAGYTSAAIAAAPVSRMDSLVRYHMFSGSRLFTNDLGNGTSPGTFLGNTKTIVSSNFGRRLKGQGNATPVGVIVPNILGSNGVVHTIDGVLRY